MASPPFNIDPTAPADNAIVSQFPLNERTNRDNTKSWLLVDHNTNGQHTHVTFTQAAAPGSPGAGLTWLYAFTDGTLRLASGAAGTEEILVPPGVVVPFAGSTVPNGWAFCNGQALSRTTFARLFAVISTTYGTGDGSTTFNVPDLRNRTVFGVDGASMGGVSNSSRLTSTTMTPDGNTYGATGGAQTVTLTIPQLPVTTPAGTVSQPTASGCSATLTQIDLNYNITTTTSAAVYGAGGGVALQSSGTATQQATVLNSATISVVQPTISQPSFTGTPFGNGQAHNNMPPALLMAWIIKW